MGKHALFVVAAMALAAAVLAVGPARGLLWTQTTEADFLEGDSSGVEVLPSGDVRLATVSSAWSREGPVLEPGPPGSGDALGTRQPFVLIEGGVWRMWYVGVEGSPARNRMMYATSSDGVTWSRQGIVMEVLTPPYNFDSIAAQWVVREGGNLTMWFAAGYWSGGPAGQWGQVYRAVSGDGIAWTVTGVALGLGPADTWDDSMVHYPAVNRDGSGRYWMTYVGWDGEPTGLRTRIGLATSADGGTFTRAGVDPVLLHGPTGSWDDSLMTSPWFSIGTPWRMWYSALDGTTTRIGRATSPDGFNWTKSPLNPDLSPGPTGSSDDTHVAFPNLVSDGGETYMYYAGNDGATWRIHRARMVTGFAPTGWYESAVLDAGAPGTVWSTLTANATVDPAASLVLRTRSGDTPTPDASWSPWSAPGPPGASAIASPRARYLQVRAELATTDPFVSPVLHEFSVAYEPNRAEAPTPTSPVGGAWVPSSSLTVEWEYEDPEADAPSGFRVEVSASPTFASIEAESGDVLSSASAWRTPPLPDGGWYWRVRTRDAYGAWGPFSTTAFAQIDTGPPATTASFSTPPDTVEGRPHLTSSNRVVLSASDPGSGVAAIAFRIDGGPEQSYSGPIAPPHGLVTVSYRAVDRAGNAEGWQALPLLVDDSPSIALAGPSDGAWSNATAVEVSWTYADPEADAQSRYEVAASPDPTFASLAHAGGVLPGPDTGHVIAGLPDGTYFWRVRAADAFGVWSDWSSPSQVRIDTTPPLTVARHGDAAIPREVFPLLVGESVELNATDGASGVRAVAYAIDGGPWQPYSGPIRFGEPGRHVLAFRATDLLGNAEDIRFVILEVRYPANYTPIVAAVLAFLIASLGLIVAQKRRAREAGIPALLAWSVAAGPATALEVVAGLYSFVTGELAMPPWFGAGLAVVIAIALAGIASLLLASRIVSSRGPPEE